MTSRIVPHRATSRRRVEPWLFLVVFGVGVLLRLLWLDKPNVLVFDERFYVGAARAMLGLAYNSKVGPGLDPNRSHPPLAKLMIALSISILGDNPWGWRIPSAIAGSLSILFVYLSVKELRGPLVALFVAFVFSFENLFFALSRIAMLDIFMLSFMLGGLYLYLKGRYAPSAALFALGTLCKLPAVFGAMAVVIYHVMQNFGVRRKGWKFFLRREAGWFSKYVLVYLVVFLTVLTVLDIKWVGLNPLDHIRIMIVGESSFTLQSLPVCNISQIVRVCYNSSPWDWVINQVQIPYLVLFENGQVGFSYFAMNPLILALLIPSAISSIHDYIRRRDSLSLLALIWILTTYLFYYPIFLLTGRLSFIYYFLPTTPGLCMAIGALFAGKDPVTRTRVIAMIFFCAAVLIVFWYFSPFVPKPTPTT